MLLPLVFILPSFVFNVYKMEMHYCNLEEGVFSICPMKAKYFKRQIDNEYIVIADLLGSQIIKGKLDADNFTITNIFR